MKVSEIMTKNPITVGPSATAREVAEKMKEKNIGTVLVTDNDSLKGIVVDRQIVLSIVATGKDPAKVKVDEFMTENPITASPEMDIEDVSQIIGENGFRRIPVVDKEKLVGILSVADIAEHAKTCTTCMTNILNEAGKSSLI